MWQVIVRAKQHSTLHPNPSAAESTACSSAEAAARHACDTHTGRLALTSEGKVTGGGGWGCVSFCRKLRKPWQSGFSGRLL